MNKGRVAILYREFLLGALITVSLFVLVALSPMVGSIIGLFIPLPIIYFYGKMGRFPAVAIFGIAVVLATMILKVLGIQDGLYFFLVIGSIGILLPEMLKRGYGIEKTIIYSSLAVLTLGVVFLLQYSLRVEKSILDLIETYIADNISYTVKVYSDFGYSTDEIEYIRENGPEITKAIISLLPGIISSGTIFLVWANAIWMRQLFGKDEMPFPDFGDLSLWKLPDWLVWFLIVSGGMILLPQEWVKATGFNLLILFVSVYLIQGLTIASFFFKRKSIPIFLRLLFYFMIIIEKFLILFVAAVGLFDIWIDFRRINRPIKDSSG